MQQFSLGFHRLFKANLGLPRLNLNNQVYLGAIYVKLGYTKLYLVKLGYIKLNMAKLSYLS